MRDPKIEHIENAYRKEEAGKRITPSAQVWKGIKRKKRFKFSWFSRFFTISFIILFFPLTCSYFSTSGPRATSLTQQKLKNELNTNHSLNQGEIISRNTSETNLLATQIQISELADRRQQSTLKQTVMSDLKTPSNNQKTETYNPSANTTYKPNGIENRSNQQNTRTSLLALAGSSFLTKTDEEIFSPDLLFDLCAEIDCDINPTLEDSILPVKPFSLKKRWEASVGLSFDKRKYALLNPNLIEGFNTTQFRESGFYLRITAPLSQTFSVDAGVEFLKGDQVSGDFLLEDLNLFWDYDTVGIDFDPVTNDTIYLLDSTSFIVDNSRFVDYKVSVETTHLPISFGYNIRKGRFGITPSLGVAYQMSRFTISTTNRAELPEPFREETPYHYNALFITGSLRLKYFLHEHLTLEVGASCRGLLFEKSDYFTSTPSPGFGIFNVGLAYQF